jgi:CRISPR-associated protein Cas5h
MNKVLVFNIRGKAAHFKKFYSNKSSLTYSLPTRTVLMGMVSSILGYSRDSYYDLFAPDKAKFGVKIIKAGVPHFECMNYLKKDGGRTQVRLQLLLPKEDMIEYQVFCVHRDQEILEKLKHKIKNEKLGYGLFLGQRQFRATAEFIKVINSPTKLKNYQGEISTLTFKDNIKELDVNNEVRLTTINMPISFKKVKSGREPEQVIKVCFEEQGKLLNGSFVEAVQLEEECISFFTPIKGD